MPSLYPLRDLRLGNEIVNIVDVRKMIENDFFPLVTSVGQRKNSHEESSLGPSDSAPRCSTTESQRLTVSEVYYQVHIAVRRTCVE